MPTVWALMGGRTGDDAQVLALAEAVGEVKVKPLSFGGLFRLPNRLLGESLASLSAGASARLEPPWPDAAIGVGRRSVPVARWIKRQSGGRTKLVRIGRPRAPLGWFDLVVTTPQYDLPAASNVLTLTLPPVRNSAPADAELERWRETFSPHPRPWIGLLVGGARWPYVLDAAAAEKLGRASSDAASRLGGTLFISTSPRTGEKATRALEGAVRPPFELHAWAPGTSGAHQAILALADRFVVTGESVSMLAEACLSGRPVEIFPLRRRWQPRWRSEAGAGRWLAEEGFLSPPRDPERVVRLLVERGHASMLGEAARRPFAPAPDGLAQAAEAVRRLLVS